MPPLTVLFVRAALVHLVIGITAGALVLSDRGYRWAPWSPLLLPADLETLLVGWTLQFAFGVAFWILPRWHGRRPGERTARAASVLLNGGVAAVGLATVFGATPWAVVAGRATETAAVVAFALHAWRRLAPPPSGRTLA